MVLGKGSGPTHLYLTVQVQLLHFTATRYASLRTNFSSRVPDHWETNKHGTEPEIFANFTAVISLFVLNLYFDFLSLDLILTTLTGFINSYCCFLHCVITGQSAGILRLAPVSASPVSSVHQHTVSHCVVSDLWSVWTSAPADSVWPHQCGIDPPASLCTLQTQDFLTRHINRSYIEN